QKICEHAINTVRAAIQATFNEVITLGYLFDTSILCQAIEENLALLQEDTLKSDIFSVNGYGLLQSVTGARDAQVNRKGIGNIFGFKKENPARSLINSDGSSHFFDAPARLGLDFYLGYFGAVARARPRCDSFFWPV